MDRDMDEMMMARHHAEMYMYDCQLAQVFQQASQIYMCKAQSNYQMYLHHSGHSEMGQMPGMMAQPMMGGMTTEQMIPSMQQPMMPGMTGGEDMMHMCPMMEHMMHEHGT